MGKQILKHKKIKKTHITRIILNGKRQSVKMVSNRNDLNLLFRHLKCGEETKSNILLCVRESRICGIVLQ